MYAIYEEAIQDLEKGKVYTYPEIMRATGLNSATAYVLQDLIAIGKIERVLHPVLDVNGYKAN